MPFAQIPRLPEAALGPLVLGTRVDQSKQPEGSLSLMFFWVNVDGDGPPSARCSNCVR